jgi:hypothetical protein
VGKSSIFVLFCILSPRYQLLEKKRNIWKDMTMLDYISCQRGQFVSFFFLQNCDVCSELPVVWQLLDDRWTGPGCVPSRVEKMKRRFLWWHEAPNPPLTNEEDAECCRVAPTLCGGSRWMIIQFSFTFTWFIKTRCFTPRGFAIYWKLLASNVFLSDGVSKSLIVVRNNLFFFEKEAGQSLLFH